MIMFQLILHHHIWYMLTIFQFTKNKKHVSNHDHKHYHHNEDYNARQFSFEFKTGWETTWKKNTVLFLVSWLKMKNSLNRIYFIIEVSFLFHDII